MLYSLQQLKRMHGVTVMGKISNRQQAILEFIKHEVRQKGYPPSVREIGEAVGLASSSTVHGHLDRLEKKGMIRRDPTKPRAIEILDDDDVSFSKPNFQSSFVNVPLLGKVTAGVPITAVEYIEEYIPLPTRMVGTSENCYMLTVSGDSMIEVGIHDGDLIIVRQQQTASNGEIVVAMTDENEATVKTYYKEKDHFRLQPENKALSPIRLSAVTILGKVIGLFREM